MADESVFRICLFCDQIRPELHHKVTILGFLGLSPYVEIMVKDPHAPLPDLCLLFVSRRLTDLREYVLGLSIKDPSGVLLFPMAEQRATLSQPRMLHIVYALRPFRLTGPGKYTVYLMVNDKLDFETSFSVLEAQAGELD